MWQRGKRLRFTLSALFCLLASVSLLAQGDRPYQSLSLEEIWTRLEQINSQLKAELAKSKSNSKNQLESLKLTQSELDSMRSELKGLKQELKKSTEDSKLLQSQLEKASQDTKEAKSSLQKAEASLKEAEKNLDSVSKLVKKWKRRAWIAGIVAFIEAVVFTLLYLRK